MLTCGFIVRNIVSHADAKRDINNRFFYAKFMQMHFGVNDKRFA